MFGKIIVVANGMDEDTCRVEFVALTNKYGAVNLGQVS